MKNLTVAFIALYFTLEKAILQEAYAQVGIGNANPHPSAVLDVNSDSDNKGMLIPRLSRTQRIAISDPADGLMSYDTDTNMFYYREKSFWSVLGVPRGAIVMWSGDPNNLPDGWALCDGNKNTPDLTGRFIAGYSGIGAYNRVGNRGGTESVNLTDDQIPSHNHGMQSAGLHSHSSNTNDGGSHSHRYRDRYYVGNNPDGNRHPDGGVEADLPFVPKLFGAKDSDSNNDSFYFFLSETSPGSHSHSSTTNAQALHSHTIGSSGGNQSHENRPPYYVLAFIMKL